MKWAFFTGPKKFFTSPNAFFTSPNLLGAFSLLVLIPESAVFALISLLVLTLFDGIHQPINDASCRVISGISFQGIALGLG